MPLKFDISGPGGDAKDVTMGGIVKTLEAKGEQVINIAPDGLSFQVMGSQGPINVPVEQALTQLGFQVKGATPMDADFSGVTQGHRAAIEAIDDEDLKKVYLQNTLQKQGVQNPQVMGSGRDFYYFDPQTGRYRALTNNPKWDSSDLVEGAMQVPRIAGMIGGGAVGGALGAGAGPVGAAAGGTLGAGTGGALGAAVSKSVVSSLNPEVNELMRENPGAQLKSLGKVAAADAVGHILPLGASKVLGSAFGKGASALAENGLASSAARGIGWAGENAGRVVNKVAKIADNEFGQIGVGSMIPGSAEAMGLGAGMQLPSQAARGATRGMEWLGERESLKSVAPGMAAKLRNASSELRRPKTSPSNFTNELSNTAEEIANALRYEPSPSSGGLRTEDIFGNAGKMAKRRMIFDDYMKQRAAGANPSFAKTAAEEANPMAQKVANTSRAFGRGVQNVENFGRVIEKAGAIPAAAAIKGAKYGGYAVGKTGSGLRAAGTVMQPVENRLLARYGAEELEDYLHPKGSWQNPQRQSNMDSILASSDY